MSAEEKVSGKGKAVELQLDAGRFFFLSDKAR
jgi:hypothetical protein